MSLESVFNQSLLSNEVILVEDGPLTPELYKVLEDFQKKHTELKRIVLPKNVGLGNALNEGLKHCSNELVIRMDTDDICFSDRFRKQVEFMTGHPDIDVSSAWLVEFEENVKNLISKKKVPATHKEISTYIKTRSPLNHPVVIFKKTVVENAGGYQHFPLFEDWYLWARMMKNGAYFANIQEPLLYFRTSSEMFKRRGGFTYAKNSAKLQWELHKLGIISSFRAIISSILRGIVYLMPNSIRRLVYTEFLRS